MPIPLPNLDDRTWTDLVEEGRSRIPAWAPDWTDHNPSDPGITLIELLAYFTEALVYRTNRISDRDLRRFLRLINGPEWVPTKDLAEDLRAATRSFSDVCRAVTAADYELIASRVPGVGRAFCIPLLDVARAQVAEEDGQALRPAPVETVGHVTVLILPKTGVDPPPVLLRKVREALDAARLLGTRVHVSSPKFVPVTVRATLQIAPGISPEEVRQKAVDSLTKFFDPLGSGPDGGWPLGRSVYVSEVCQVLQRVPGVLVARKAIDPATRRPVDFIAAAESESRRLKYNRLQELESIELQPHELVRVAVDEELFRV